MSSNTKACTECDKQVHPTRRGMCMGCYCRWWRENRDVAQRPAAHDRFWSKVSKSSGCWEWQAYRDGRGYGRIFWDGRPRPASQVALILSGSPKPEGVEACHRCDNPPCVNPTHLYWGTRQDNIDDAYARGQRAGGERHSAARLTEAQVVEIREAFATGADYRDLGSTYGIDPRSIFGITSGKKWPQAPGPITRRKTNRKEAAA